MNRRQLLAKLPVLGAVLCGVAVAPQRDRRNPELARQLAASAAEKRAGGVGVPLRDIPNGTIPGAPYPGIDHGPRLSPSSAADPYVGSYAAYLTPRYDPDQIDAALLPEALQGGAWVREQSRAGRET